MQFVEFLNVIYNHGRTDIKGERTTYVFGCFCKAKKERI